MRPADDTAPAPLPREPAIAQASPAAVRAQLERLRLQAFAGSAKLFAFLRFVVEEALAGRAATLKEVVIGIELYGSRVDYAPASIRPCGSRRADCGASWRLIMPQRGSATR